MAKEKTMKFKILALSANDKAIEWAIKIKSVFGLDEAKKNYQVGIAIDEEYFENKVNDLQNKIKSAESKPDMFEDFKATIKSLNDNIKGVEKEQKNLEALIADKLADFPGTVEVADFSKDIFVLTVPEAIVPDLINIRHNVEAFVVNLK